MAVLHVRNVPDSLYHKLRKRAEEEGRSISTEVIVMLDRSLRFPYHSQSELLKALARRRKRFNPQKAGAPSSLALLREDRAR